MDELLGELGGIIERRNHVVNPFASSVLHLDNQLHLVSRKVSVFNSY